MILSRLVLIILCVTLHDSNGEDYHPDRTLLMDYYSQANSSTNFLFRGNMPIVNGSFAYKQILTTMLSIIQKHNFTMPTDYSLTVISYLNGFEYNDLEIERKFFTANPNLGQLYNKVIAGSLIPPPQNDTQLIKSIVEGYTDPIDDLPNLMKFIRGQLTQIKPVLIYTHCEAGTDRTGEVSGAYYMTYLNMTFTQALDVDNHVQSRDMKIVSRNAMQWYCFYLKFVKDYHWLQCQV